MTILFQDLTWNLAAHLSSGACGVVQVPRGGGGPLFFGPPDPEWVGVAPVGAWGPEIRSHQQVSNQMGQ